MTLKLLGLNRENRKLVCTGAVECRHHGDIMEVLEQVRANMESEMGKGEKE